MEPPVRQSIISIKRVIDMKKETKCECCNGTGKVVKKTIENLTYESRSIGDYSGDRNFEKSLVDKVNIIIDWINNL